MVRVILAALLLSFATALPQAHALPGLQQDARTPLVIIRFSQRNVYFEKALYNAVNKAVAAKPDVVFDVVVRPGFRSSLSGNNLGKVTSSLAKMGVPERQITYSTGSASGERHDEIFVYVR